MKRDVDRLPRRQMDGKGERKATNPAGLPRLGPLSIINDEECPLVWEAVGLSDGKREAVTKTEIERAIDAGQETWHPHQARQPTRNRRQRAAGQQGSTRTGHPKRFRDVNARGIQGDVGVNEGEGGGNGASNQRKREKGEAHTSEQLQV